MATDGGRSSKMISGWGLRFREIQQVKITKLQFSWLHMWACCTERLHGFYSSSVQGKQQPEYVFSQCCLKEENDKMWMSEMQAERIWFDLFPCKEEGSCCLTRADGFDNNAAPQLLHNITAVNCWLCYVTFSINRPPCSLPCLHL